MLERRGWCRCVRKRAVIFISKFEIRKIRWVHVAQKRKEEGGKGRQQQQEAAAGWERKLQKKGEEEMILESVILLGPIDMGKFEDFDSPAT